MLWWCLGPVMAKLLSRSSDAEIDDAAEQGVEADEARSTSELRSLTPVFAGLPEGPRTDPAGCCQTN
jgi:hypothetical protein